MTCPCGGIILADTETWATPLCYECYRFGGLEKRYNEVIKLYDLLVAAAEADYAHSMPSRQMYHILMACRAAKKSSQVNS